MMTHDGNDRGRRNRGGMGWLTITGVFTLALGGCVEAADPTATTTHDVSVEDLPLLETGGWFAGNRDRINQLVRDHGRRSPGFDPSRPPVVALDWDNTITKNDTGDRFTFYMARRWPACRRGGTRP